MIAHDLHNITLVYFSEYGPRQELVITWVYLWLRREGFRAYP